MNPRIGTWVRRVNTSYYLERSDGSIAYLKSTGGDGGTLRIVGIDGVVAALGGLCGSILQKRQIGVAPIKCMVYGDTIFLELSVAESFFMIFDYVSGMIHK